MASDFSLVEAIESGIVKIPRVPVDDNAATPNVQFLHLWPLIKDGLPKKGRKEGAVTPDQMPGMLEGALNALYDSYAKAFAAWENSDAKKYGEPAPVFIVVCNNTTVSKMVYDYIAGWEKPLSDYQTVWVEGKLKLFSNVEYNKPIARPRTILEPARDGERLPAERHQGQDRHRWRGPACQPATTAHLLVLDLRVLRPGRFVPESPIIDRVPAPAWPACAAAGCCFDKTSASDPWASTADQITDAGSKVGHRGDSHRQCDAE